jgi:hypothetical protein
VFAVVGFKLHWKRTSLVASTRASESDHGAAQSLRAARQA